MKFTGWRGRAGVSLATLAMAGVWVQRAVPAATDPDVRRDLTVAVVERVLPTAVNIATATIIPQRDIWQQFWGNYQRSPRSVGYSAGSGVLIDEEGYLLTNDHVVRGADKIWVNPATSTNIYEAVVVAMDPRADLALLKIQAPPGAKFPAIRFAQEDELLGETVLAMGNPVGLGGSVSRGIISSKSRVEPDPKQTLDVPNWIQTDASINLGNSGGPLVNLRGQLIGVNVARPKDYAQPGLRSTQGIGFAIPARQVIESLSAMVTPESSNRRLWFGARVNAGGGPLAIGRIEPASPAALAGLAVGDVITAVNGQPATSFIRLNERLVTAGPDVSLTVARGERKRTVQVRLIPLADVFNADLLRRRLGVSFQPLTAKAAQALGLTGIKGWVVTAVETNLTEMLGPGALVTSLDGRPLDDLVDAARTVAGKRAGEKVRLGFIVQQRQGNLVTFNQAAVDVPVR